MQTEQRLRTTAGSIRQRHNQVMKRRRSCSEQHNKAQEAPSLADIHATPYPHNMQLLWLLLHLARPQPALPRRAHVLLRGLSVLAYRCWQDKSPSAVPYTSKSAQGLQRPGVQHASTVGVAATLKMQLKVFPQGHSM